MSIIIIIIIIAGFSPKAFRMALCLSILVLHSTMMLRKTFILFKMFTVFTLSLSEIRLMVLKMLVNIVSIVPLR